MDERNCGTEALSSAPPARESPVLTMWRKSVAKQEITQRTVATLGPGAGYAGIRVASNGLHVEFSKFNIRPMSYSVTARWGDSRDTPTEERIREVEAQLDAR